MFTPWSFSPIVLRPALWLDASDASTLYSGASLAAADGAISEWRDKSGNARHATQETGISQPLRKTAIQNGRDVVRFDGSNDTLTLGSDLSLGTQHTIFVVAENTATITAATSAQMMINGGGPYAYPSTTTSELLIAAGSVTGALTNERLCGIVLAHGASATTVYGYGKTNADVSGAFVLCHQFTTSGNVFVGRLNGNSDFVTAAAVSGGYSATNTRYPSILRIVGGRSNSSTYWNGDILEVIAYPTSLSVSDREAVEAYLNAKWNLY